jgi:hypothetical protein
MGSRYTTQATTGYNSSPPLDDGTQAAANLITWAGIKSKLADVLKTFGEAINTSLVSAFDYSVRQISASDSTVLTDHMRCVEIAPTVTTAVTVSLGDAATMTTVYRVYIKNSSAINQTVGRVTGGDTIDGTAGNVTLAPGEGRIFQTNSTPNGYLTVSRFGPFIDTNPVAVGSSDGTKKVRLEVDGLTTATTRVLTVADADITLIGINGSTTVVANALLDISGASGGQIKFPATQNASSNANTLDDYEEGTFTPTGIGQTFTTVTGTYTKIGRAVHVVLSLLWSVNGAGNQAGSGSLPFAISTAGGICAVGFFNSVKLPMGLFVASTSRIDFYQYASGGPTMLDSDLSGSQVQCGGMYYT